ncbi:MAG: DUF4062 domain-containing protein [Acidobacteria bacterium]|nr:DUF4062 domain-containing protein [Acidobacteriota bacterium]
MASDERRFQVFVSSTYLDLLAERQAVIHALLSCDAFPAGMELFPAADDDAWTLIQRVIDDSDYYLLVVGGKYGSVDPVDDVSYTEKEYDHAVARGKPVLAFLHGDPGQIPAKLTERSEDMQAKLDAFRKKVEGSKHVKYWTSADGLAGQVALSFNRFAKQYPAVGWIRADQATETESLRALSEARTRIDELERQVKTIRTAPPPGTESLAQGQDVFRLPLLMRATFRRTGYKVDNQSLWISPRPTWDDIFGGVAPHLIHECEQSKLKTELEAWARREFWVFGRDQIVRKLRKERDDMEPEVGSGDLSDYRILIADEDFGTVLVQLKALGLIATSDKRRSVTDTGTYWTLTPFGDTRMIQLRAIPKDVEADVDGPAESEENVGQPATS